MIHLEKGEKLFSDETKVVCATGDYDYFDLVEVSNELDNFFPSYQYPAIFIKYGHSNVDDLYNVNNDEKKFKINNSFDDPSYIDYDILGFNKKRTFIKGELKEVGYYKNYDNINKTYSDLAVLETREYNRDQLGLVINRNQTSIWYLNDDTTGLTKTFTKYYSSEEAIQEGIDRRTNLISFAKSTLLHELGLLYGEPTNLQYSFDLLTSVKTEIEYFIQGYRQPLVNSISASTKPYLTENIKIKTIDQLTI